MENISKNLIFEDIVSGYRVGKSISPDDIQCITVSSVLYEALVGTKRSYDTLVSDLKILNNKIDDIKPKISKTPSSYLKTRLIGYLYVLRDERKELNKLIKKFKIKYKLYDSLYHKYRNVLQKITTDKKAHELINSDVALVELPKKVYNKLNITEDR